MKNSKLIVARAKKGWTQNVLANTAGICRATISQIENGKIDNIQLGTLKKIAVALNTTVQELFLDE